MYADLPNVKQTLQKYRRTLIYMDKLHNISIIRSKLSLMTKYLL